MPALLNNPAHWQLRADETRLLADHLIDPEAKATILPMNTTVWRVGRSRGCNEASAPK
jgi:hypothetical protein